MIDLRNIIKNLSSPIDEEAGALINISNFQIRLSIFMSANAILQAILDLVVEGLMFVDLTSFKIPFRLEFLFITLISTLIAYLTLKGLREGNLDVTKNNLFIGLVVESSLVLGDVYLLLNTHKDFWPIFFFRLFFIVLTFANILIISYLLHTNFKTRRLRPHYRF